MRDKVKSHNGNMTISAFKWDRSPSEGGQKILAAILKGHFKPKSSKLATSKGPSELRISKGTIDGHFLAPIMCIFFAWWWRLHVGNGMMTQKGTSRNSCLVPYTLQPFEALTPDRLKKSGHRDEPLEAFPVHSLALDGTPLSVITVLYVGVLYPCHQASKCANRKKKKQKLKCVLSLSHTHTHTHTHTHIQLYIHAQGKYCNPTVYVYTMYIEYCCSVGTFGAKFLFYFWYIFIFKYINIVILLEWICLSSDLPDVIISICAGQLWTIGKIELLAKTWVL